MKVFFMIIQIFLLTSTNCLTCANNDTITNKECFNEVLIFNIENKYYRSGHFATNTKGDMIIEYSYGSYRLFFGLKKDGKYYFPEKIKEINITSDEIESSMLNRYESANIFVSLANDTNKEKEYLLSVSSYITILELHDLESDKYNIEKAITFLENEYGIYAYVFQILEAKINNKNNYFIVYTYRLDTSERYEVLIAIKRFEFEKFNFEPIADFKKIDFYNGQYLRIISSILIEDYNLLAVFYLRTSYYVNFYDLELNKQNEQKIIEISTSSYLSGESVFYKSIHLYDQYISFLYFLDYKGFGFQILVLKNYTISDKKLYYEDNSTIFFKEPALNDFIKIDNDRLVFISTTNSYTASKLYIIFFDLYNNLEEMAVRYYFYNFWEIGVLSKELSGFLYNGFLAFTSTFLPSEGINEEFNSIFLLFSYANGTDFDINIYPYLSDIDSYDPSNNLYNILIEKLVIDNNIFGYERVEQIKLVSIPDEIEFHSGSDDSLISNGLSINADSILKQNKNIMKNNNFYNLEYQYIVQEPQYSDFYHSYTAQTRFFNSGDLSSYFNPKKFYGRTNTLKFKLCHDYCKTCTEFGSSNIDQKCISCSEQYSYNSNAQINSLCIPEGYFYDSQSGVLIQCSIDNSKFYIDITNNNKRICFKNTENCPSDYPFYDEETKECSKYDKNIPTTIIENTPSKISETENNFSPKTSKIEGTTKIKLDTEIPRSEKRNKGNCSLEDLVDNSCSSLNYTNDDIKEKIDNELLNDFNVTFNQSIEIKGENNTVFQLTTTDNEINRFNGNMLNNNGLSVIDLGNCETLLKIHYKINNDTALIIKKYEQITISAERNVQYEVYHPISKEKLNLSVCDEETIDLYIPVELNEQLIELYDDLQNNGYDLFNIDDPFYNDLCSPYKSKNGTDVLLSDRKNDYYNNNYTTCQQNCEYSSFNSEYKFLKCECKVIVDDIDINKFNKFSKKIYKNFYDILKNSNYKTLKCHKLVFNPGYLKKNIGSFVVLAFFAGYLGFFIIYIIKGITPLQEEAIKTICNKFKDININILEKSLTEKNIIDIKTEKQNIIEFPPKKRKSVVVESGLNLEKVEKKDKKRRKSKNLKKSETIKDRRKSVKDNINIIDEPKNDIFTGTNNDIFENKEKNKLKKKRKSKDKIIYNDASKSNDKLDDLDLNNLTYDKALELDKRTFTQVYWNKLKSKHLIIYTFFSCYDYNLVYIKVSRFLFLICTSMAMNVIFFFDSSMHKIYMDYGKYNFIQQIPQIIYSSLVSLIIEILIGILSYTDKNIYQIRQIEKFSIDKLKEILKAIRIKLIIYFIVTFLFFAFYWYLISSFCAVYTNTQKIYLKDFATSFSLGLIYPFAIQLCFAFLRIFTLKEKSKARSFLYKIC